MHGYPNRQYQFCRLHSQRYMLTPSKGLGTIPVTCGKTQTLGYTQYSLRLRLRTIDLAFYG